MDNITEEEALSVVVDVLKDYIEETDPQSLINFYNTVIELPDLSPPSIRVFTTLRDKLIEFEKLPRED